jgi:acetyl/propionyl-CoA carboxylase alpha subunit
MYKITVNDKLSIDAEWTKNKKEFNGNPMDADIVEIRAAHFHIIHNLKSYSAEVISYNREDRSMLVKINGNKYTVTVKDEMDELLHKLGMDSSDQRASGDIKAPMPGLVLDVKVSAGQKISKGDAIIVLEAMKMENVLKASNGGIVKKVSVSKGDKVEKNQVMMVIE